MQIFDIQKNVNNIFLLKYEISIKLYHSLLEFYFYVYFLCEIEHLLRNKYIKYILPLHHELALQFKKYKQHLSQIIVYSIIIFQKFQCYKWVLICLNSSL